MKTLFTIVALAFAVSAHAADPVNKECPVAGKPIKAGVTAQHDGKTVGFCCNNCKGKFEKDPSKYASKIK
jgi:YHS domain-containing protein